MYEETTRGIRVIVKPKYLESQSRPDDDHFVWAYTITIENHGPETVTLRSRYWKITDARGRVICGTMRADPFSTEGPRTPGECWRIDAEGQATMLYGDVSLTNGIGFSPDGSVLYHSDTAVRGVWAHDYADDGSVSGRRFLVQQDDLQPDGLAVDEAGTVWVADVSGSSSLRGFSPEGKEISRIPVPARMVTSLCFGGADRQDLYIVTADNREDPDRGGTIFRTRAEVAGCRVPPITV